MNELHRNEELRKKTRKILPFRFLDPGPADFLLERSELLSFEEQETIIRQGELNHDFYSILAGNVNVTVRNENGSESYICSIGEGEVFGEAGMFLKVPRTASVVACTPVQVVRIPRKSMLKLIREFPENGNKFLMMIIFSLLRKLKGSNQELAFERREDAHQEEIDALVEGLLG